MPVQDVADVKQRLMDTWNGLSQSIIDDADDEWRKRLRACVKEGGHEQYSSVLTAVQSLVAIGVVVSAIWQL